MPRIVPPLTDAKCEAAKPKDKEYPLFDGQGLHLLVKPSGIKVWRFKFTRPNGKLGLMTFGRYPAFTLKQARDQRAEAMALCSQGIDPIDDKKQRQIKASNATTFEFLAKGWHQAQVKRGKWSPSHAERVWRDLERYLLPSLGQRAIETLKTRDLLVPLQRVEAQNILDTAVRLQQRIRAIMTYGVQTGLTDYNPANDLQGAMTTPKATHRPALPLNQLGELLQRIEGYTGRPVTRLALLLTLHLFVRSSELRFARWTEIDFDQALWTIPAQREALAGVKHSTRGSKMHDEHLVPLSPQALALLQALHHMTGQYQLVFPSDAVSLKPMSENTVNAALRRLGYDTKTEVCGHGFRTMACSALVESGLWTRDAVERQMSHKERNGVRAAYIHRAEHLDERRLMLNWWSNYLEANRQKAVAPFEYAKLTVGNVVEMKQA